MCLGKIPHGRTSFHFHLFWFSFLSVNTSLNKCSRGQGVVVTPKGKKFLCLRQAQMLTVLKNFPMASHMTPYISCCICPLMILALPFVYMCLIYIFYICILIPYISLFDALISIQSHTLLRT